MPFPEFESPNIGQEADHNKVSPPNIRYIKDKEVGSGAFGKVYKVICSNTLEKCAMKVMNNKTEQEKECNKEEVSLLRRLTERGFDEFNLLKYHHSNMYKDSIEIITELLDMDLFSYIYEERKGPLQLESVKKIAYQVLNGIIHLNKFGYSHTDIKLENIMFVDRNGLDPLAIKLIDFGCAQSLSWLSLRGQGQNMTTIGYRSPEVLCGCAVTEKLDIWSIGVVIFELYTGFPLFTADNQYQLLKQINDIIGLNECLEAGDYFEEYVEVIEKEINGVLTKKYSVQLQQDAELPEVYYKLNGFKKLHKFGYNSREGSGVTKEDRQLTHLVHRMLTVNQFERISVDEAMQHPLIKSQKTTSNS